MDGPDLIELMPFAASIGVRIIAVAAESCVGALDWAPQLTTAGGGLHGGALMSLADSVGAACAYVNLPAGATTSTISSNSVFLRAVRAGTVTATARPLHVGRSTVAVLTELRDESGRLVAQVTQTQTVHHP